MNYQKFIQKGLLRKDKIGFDQVKRLLEKSFKDLKAAEILGGSYQTIVIKFDKMKKKTLFDLWN